MIWIEYEMLHSLELSEVERPFQLNSRPGTR